MVDGNKLFCLWVLAASAVGLLACDDGGGEEPSLCSPSPCGHGICIEDPGGGAASCECDEGWTGDLCDEVVDPGGCAELTAEAPLSVDVSGTDVGDTATYSCDEGFTIEGEELRLCGEEGWEGEEPVCVDEVCADHLCENDGLCVPDGADGYTCECAPGFEGDHCETNIDDCTPDPCANGGTCVDGVDAYVCDCSTAPGWEGLDCDEDIPDCATEPCVHGTCTEGDPGTGEYSCECDAGYEGTNCNIVTDLCDPNPCLNGGACVMGDPGAFTCECADGYEGDTCETNIDDCDPNPCLHGGTCTDGVDAYSCTCPFGWSGDDCEREVSGCADDPCIHATVCTDTGPGTYDCTCEAGWEGDNCELNIDDCASTPCLHGGTCIDGVDSFTCDCSTAAGWEGPTCDTMTDLCTPNPCLNGGSCSMPGAGVFDCSCVGGYTGDLCEIAPGTTECVITYALDVGNGDDGGAYTGCNMRIRDTFWGMGDTTAAIGPGMLIIRVPSDGGTSPAPGTAEVLYYELTVEFTTTAGATVVTDVDAFSPTLGAIGNTTAQATGVLSTGGTPTITWGTCTFPAGYNDANDDYDPDVVGTGAGCLAPYRSVGNVRCESGFCSAGGLARGDNPQDETWEQELSTLTFSSDMSTFTMPWMLVPNRTPSRTYVSWSGVRTDIDCH